MWRCPRCVAHVKDELLACPACEMVKPGDTPARQEDDWSDLADHFPDKEPPVALLPALPERSLDTGMWGPCKRGFLVGFFGTVVVAFVASLIWPQRPGNTLLSVTDALLLGPLW